MAHSDGMPVQDSRRVEHVTRFTRELLDVEHDLNRPLDIAAIGANLG